MGNRTAKFISALLASVAAGAPLSAISQTAPAEAPAATASDDCLAAPKKTAPDGQHWYYRLERGSKRQCWYLRAEGAKTVSINSAQSSTQSGAAPPAPTRKADAPAPRSLQDARAEWPSSPPASDTQTNPAASSATRAAPARSTTADGVDQPSVTARWPDPSAVAAPPQPASPPVRLADARPDPALAAPATAPAPVALAAAEVPVERPAYSVQTLLLVIGGALALAGLIGSAIVRFAGSRVRVPIPERPRRGVNWDTPADNARAPWSAAAEPRRPQPQSLDAFDAPIDDVREAPRRVATRAPRIEPVTRVAPDTLSGVDPVANDPVQQTAADARDWDVLDDTAADIGHAQDDVDADGEPAEQDHADRVDIDVITQILERLAKEGPRLAEPRSAETATGDRTDPIDLDEAGRDEASLAAGSGDFARSRRDRSGVRA